MSAAWNYELLVKEIYDSLLRQEGVAVHHRRKYVGKCSRQPYEIDLSFQFSKASVEFLVLVECKYYSRPVEVGDALEFAQKVEDIAAHKGILVSTVGFQKGVFRVARSAGIALVKVDEPGTFDTIISSEGSGVYFYGPFSEYGAGYGSRSCPLLAIIHSFQSVEGGGVPVLYTDSLMFTTDYGIRNGSLASLLDEFLSVD